MSLLQLSSPPSTSTRIPGLPFELLSEIIKEARREDLRAIHATSRVFREIARPLLFREIVIHSIHEVMGSLLNLAQSAELADLVRSLSVLVTCVPSRIYEQSDEILNNLAVAISLLPRLETFRLENFPGDLLVLNRSLELPILFHSTLRLFAYDRWHSSGNPYDLSLTRTRAHSLTIERVAYPEDAYTTSNSLGIYQFYENVISFIHHHNLRIHHLDHKRYEEDDFPLPLLLSTPLAGLVVLTLGTFSSHEFFPELLTETDWLSLFLKAHPFLRRLEFEGSLDPREQDDSGLIFLPWPAFSHIDGLEALSNEELIPWSHFGSMERLVLELSSEEGREVVTLALERVAYHEVEALELKAEMIEALAVAFPNLRTLSIGGNFRTPQVAQSIAALAGFHFLSTLHLPFSISRPDRPDLDQASVEYILHELDDENSRDAKDMTDSERDHVRHRILASGLHWKRTFAYYVAPFEDDWRRLFVSSSSLEELEWFAYAGDELQGSLACRRDELGSSNKSIFGARSKEMLEQEPPGYCWWGWEDLMDWVLSGPPLFKQDADFVPAFTLDRFFAPSS